MDVGATVDRYRIERELGRGGMGAVYEALDTRLGRRVALKVVASGGETDQLASQRMLREARAAAAFEHPNAVVVYDAGLWQGSTFIAMELVRGRTLRALVDDASALPQLRIRWLVDAARALGAAHRAGLVHRDVKPDNVMLADDGRVKVLDFGIARAAAGPIDTGATAAAGVSTLTAEGVIVCTPQYASPEQLRGEDIGGRSDQFSWAVMAYELLGGALPWASATSPVALISQILSAEVTPLSTLRPDVPANVSAAIARALSKQPGDRFASMDEAADALERDAARATPFSVLEPTQATPSNSADTIAAPVEPAEPGPSDVHSASTPAAAIVDAASVTDIHTPAAPAPRAAAPGARPERRRATRPGVFAATAVALAAFATAGLGAAGVGPLASIGRRLGRDDVTRLACSRAVVDGAPSGASEELADAIGVGACARAAAQLGVEWEPSGGESAMVVRATLSSKGAVVRAAFDGVTAEGKGATAIDAMTAAAARLALELHAAPMTAEQVRAWGATDAASARRIERLIRGIDLGFIPDTEPEAKALVAAQPGSAWSHLAVVFATQRMTTAWQAERARGLELTSTLPPARALAVRGVLLYLGAETDRELGLGELRKAYAADPDDPDIATYYAGVAMERGMPAEGFAVVDRILGRAPSGGVQAIRSALSYADDRDLDRDGRYIAALVRVLPERRADAFVIRDLVRRGRFDEARAALAFGAKLGLAGRSADATALLETRVFVELAAYNPKEARAIAAPMISQPSPVASAKAGRHLVDSLWLEGLLDDALSAEVREADRQRELGNARDAAILVVSHASVLRRLGRPPVAAEQLAEAQQTIARDTPLSPFTRVSLEAELGLLREAEGERAAALEAIEREIEADARGDAKVSGGLGLAALALVRAVRGDAAAADAWRGAKSVPRWYRMLAAVEAGAALQRAGAPAEAVAVFELAADPSVVYHEPLKAMIAHARLSPLYKELGRAADAEREAALIHRVWVAADPALVALAERY